MKAPSIRRASATVIGVALFAKGIGFLREMVVAAVFGTSRTVDVYLAALAIPALVGTVLAYSLPNTFVPLFTAARAGERPGRHAARVVVAIAVLAIGVFAFAPAVADLTSRGFAAPERQETVFALRILAGSMIFLALEALLRSRLHAAKRFVRPGLAFACQSVTIIAAVALFPGGGVRTLAVGYLVGTVAAVVWNLLPGPGGLGRGGGEGVAVAGAPAASDSGAPESVPAVASGADPAPSGPVGRWVLAVLLVDAASQLYGLLDRRFGSFLGEGSIAAVQYANLLTFLPMTILATGLSTAIFPFLSEAVLIGDRKRAGHILDRAVRWSLVGIVPVTVLLFALSEPLVALLFERGAFGADSRLLTASVVRPLAWGLMPGLFVTIAAKVFHAGRRWRPVMVSVGAGLLVKAVVSRAAVASIGVTGLAWGTVAGLGTAAVVFLVALPGSYVAGHRTAWLRYAVTLLALSAIGVVPARFRAAMLPEGTKLADLAVVAVAALGVLVAVGGLGARLGLAEVREVLRRLPGRRPDETGAGETPR